MLTGEDSAENVVLIFEARTTAWLPEAAAATAIVDRSITAKPSVANSVSFDRPFIFGRCANQMTGVFLLSGYVGSLLAEAVAESCASARDCPQK
jgi:hypothetical protein